jgi:FAD/FMN-containing dehydrogenase
VKWAKTAGADFTIRTGGNDFYGRFVVDGGLMIDMRELKSIEVAEDKMTATIGGGTIMKDLVEKLADEGLIAPSGNAWTVGYVGWATQGGYGPLTNPLGMGFEGIVGAEVVNAEGEVVQASDEMLEGIRGMGGNLGVITSLTIKVYPNRDVGAPMIGCNSMLDTCD